jgi:hypothetical protein
MNQATSIEQEALGGSATKRKKLVVVIAATLILVAVVVLALGILIPPTVKISPASESREVPVDSKLKISTSRLRGEIESVEVKETSLSPLGAPLETKVLDGGMQGSEFVVDDGSTLNPDSRYEVTVHARLRHLGLTGFTYESVVEQSTFYTIVTPAPLFSKSAQVVEIDQPIVVEFNTPIDDFSYEISPELKSTSSIDEENPTRALIKFEGYEQGKQYTLTIKGATAENGAVMQKPASQPIATTSPLKVTFIPGDEEAGVSTGARPTLTFTEDIRNPEIAESLITMEPDTLGSWDWITSDSLQFKPLDDWAQSAQITIKLHGGTGGLRGNSGSFLREDVQSTFTVKPSKMIDVNLSTQTVVLYDNDQQVKTLVCSSGAKATPSLTGTYAVYAKAEKLDMQGEGYNAPDVPWVLMFNGDYTIHGNYWSTNFGTPTSHGCVGLPLSDAEFVYNWAPIGTIVSIHY